METGKKATFIAILRGINVGGKNRMKMPDLVSTFESLGLTHVRSYIQSGNIVFETLVTKATLELEKDIHEQIGKDFGFEIPVLVIEAAEMERILRENPFVDRKDIDLTKLHVTFLGTKPEENRLAAIDPEKYKPDEFVVKGKFVYLRCPVDYGHTKLNNGFFETKLKVKATTRNWNTVKKLGEMAEN